MSISGALRPARTISVILPNRNHAHFLPRALGALARQSRLADEIIVIDDASSDDSIAVIESWRDRLPGLKLTALAEHRGVVGALNLGLAQATGDLVYAAAADDAAKPALFSTALAAFDRHPEAGVFCAEALVIDDEGTGRAIRPAAAPLRATYLDPTGFRDWLRGSDNLCVGVACLARREPMLAEGGYDLALGPYCDSFLVRRIALAHGVVFVPEVLGEWHRSMQGISRSLARDADLTIAYIAEARRRIEADRSGLYPDGYGDMFARRASFNAARLALPDAGLAARLSGVAETRLAALGRLPVVGRQAAMAALTLSLRPMSLPRLFLTRAMQRLRAARDPSRLQMSGQQD
ncbi:MAG: glycosyltransferase [Phreatobacter sp.]|uniref:glycosyltransferase family 2 protein n=1 Tax=Phreatobacter sp. TaxID=1966341 RepID=UPI00273509EF|nr:glycosyltransferase [Phreatobacter sp.]MDP2804060.1 glycosyltransferase [Phreatobacter sp.]